MEWKLIFGSEVDLADDPMLLLWYDGHEQKEWYLQSPSGQLGKALWRPLSWPAKAVLFCFTCSETKTPSAFPESIGFSWNRLISSNLQDTDIKTKVSIS